jgi:hypothetical protein
MPLPRLSPRAQKIAFPAISGIVALGFSFLFVPDELISFRLAAVLSAMAGYAVGDLVAQSIFVVMGKIVAILLGLVVAISTLFMYVVFSQVGAADVLLLVLIAVGFFAMGALFALTGVRPHLPVSKVR